MQLTPSAEGEFADLPLQAQKPIARWLDLLADDPYRKETKKLGGKDTMRRVHAGKDYVIVYEIEKTKVLILILRVGLRKEIYRNL